MVQSNLAIRPTAPGSPGISSTTTDRSDRGMAVVRGGANRAALHGQSADDSLAEQAPGSALDGRRVLDALPVAIIRVEREGRILHANEQARRLLEAYGGLTRVFGNHLSARNAEDARRLRRAITAGCDGRQAWTAVSRPAGGGRLFVTALPSAAANPRCGEVILMVIDSEFESPALIGRLRDLFGLTRAEAEVAVGLGRGQDLTEIGETRAVKLSTLRDQISSIFAKTHTCRQAQLASLVSRLAVFG